jgi:polygalacturonase
MEQIFYVNDFLKPSKTDSEAIEDCFYAAENISDTKIIIFNAKDYCIDRAILVPSNTHIIIDNCTIKQNDNVFDNVFRGNNIIVNEIEPYDTPIDVTPIHNIKIIGKGNAKIVGTDKPRIGYHPFFKDHQQMVGDFWGWRTHMFSFSLCNNFELSSLHLLQTMGWAVSFDNCENCNVNNLYIRSNVKNGDGINFRSGCNNCAVDNISGFTSDDTIACTALSRGKQERALTKYLYISEPYNSSHENIDTSIHHIKINNIFTGGHHHGVICLSAYGNKVHDIDISNIIESREGQRQATVKIYTGYGDGYNAGDINNIKINNVTSEISEYSIMIDCKAEDLEINNIVQNNPKGKTIY